MSKKVNKNVKKDLGENIKNIEEVEKSDTSEESTSEAALNEAINKEAEGIQNNMNKEVLDDLAKEIETPEDDEPGAVAEGSPGKPESKFGRGKMESPEEEPEALKEGDIEEVFVFESDYNRTINKMRSQINALQDRMTRLENKAITAATTHRISEEERKNGIVLQCIGCNHVFKTEKEIDGMVKCPQCGKNNLFKNARQKYLDNQ